MAFDPVPRAAVRLLSSGFLGHWQQLNADATIPHCIRELEKSGAIDNLRRLVDGTDKPYRGYVFADSDIYKVLEAIAWEVGRTGTTAFDMFVDHVVKVLQAAQRSDGYLNSWVQGHAGEQPFEKLRWSHELYCLGHLIQAAVAWNRATGRQDLLNVATRFANYTDAQLGEHGRAAVDGHPEVETALVELFRVTGEARYLNLAARFIDLRGHRTVGEDALGYAYFQDHTPIREATEVAGHAVRQLYLAAGATDVLLEREDTELETALERLWRSAHEEKMYLTGGMGSRHTGEAFGDPFELPSDRAYAETCAAIADFQWNWRMLLYTGQSRFADAMERVLYNAIAAGESISGTEFFYSTPLHRREHHHPEANAPTRRQGWYSCACCPPNLARLAASLDSYIVTSTPESAWIHFYSDTNLTLNDGDGHVAVTMRTAYPWDGKVTLTFDRPLNIELRLRVPGWAETAALSIDGALVHPALHNGYLVIPAGTVNGSVEVDLAMTATLVYPHPRVDAIRHSVAVTRGPIVFCLEQNDLPDDVDADDVRISTDAALDLTTAPDGLDVPALTLSGLHAIDAQARPLYQCGPTASTLRDLAPVSLIPYFRWGNRRKAAVRVWIPRL